MEHAAGSIGVDLDQLDVCDRDACFRVINKVRPTHFIHAAAVTHTDDVDGSTYAVNFNGTANVLDAALAVGTVKRGIILSSGAVYGPPDGLPCDESHPLRPTGAYALAKRDAECLISNPAIPVIAARIGPVYGPFESVRPSRPRITFIGQLLEHLKKGSEIKIFGTDMSRDWTHAADIAEALHRLLFAPVLNHKIYNVSNGISISARDIIHQFVNLGLNVCYCANATQADIILNEKDSRQPLVIERLKADTGFTPRYDLRAGIRQLYDSI